MALLLDYVSTVTGLTVDDSYWNVGEVFINNQAKTATIKFYGYVSQTGYQGGKENFDIVTFNVNDDAVFDSYFAKNLITGEDKDIYKQCYLFAKDTQTFFEGAVDA